MDSTEDASDVFDQWKQEHELLTKECYGPIDKMLEHIINKPFFFSGELVYTMRNNNNNNKYTIILLCITVFSWLVYILHSSPTQEGFMGAMYRPYVRQISRILETWHQNYGYHTVVHMLRKWNVLTP